MATTKPDFDNYVDRIKAIQKATISGSQAAKFPLPSGLAYPYWLNVYLPHRLRPHEDAATDVLNLVLQMQLIRGTRTNMFQPDIEQKILNDHADVLWEFMTDEDSQRLIVGAFTAIQAGFIPGSLNITTTSRTELPQGGPVIGDVIGSFFNLTWQHRMRRTLGA
ncbi:hypothetical protein LCGC14_0933890 [marine sediment metagenome]|uniref:Uncharacterized protein n=1 Tax=marine sediment metagenome TaxID=412755 RepID=A0A0F9NRN5_9ZZZZ